MGLRDFLKKKDELDHGEPADQATVDRLNAPEFTFIRSDTSTQEQIYPPGTFKQEPKYDDGNLLSPKEPSKARRSLDVFRSSRSRSASVSSQGSHSSNPKESRRLSHRLHLTKAPESSQSVPTNLPDIVAPANPEDKDAAESQWEKRATMLASQNDMARSRPASPVPPTDGVSQTGLGGQQPPRKRSPSVGPVSSKTIDEDIQEAIRLHEEGDLERSTRLFGKLADPRGANNPLSQVLYGLALRHGWGCAPDPAGAVNYLSAAASNSASIEQMALQAGMKKGGAAKGELVLAIFELANCFRHGWGIPKDPYAAKQYYETAANLGDTDAMNEIAWCYLEGFGCKKDKFASARYYRLAEKAGNKTLGNSWIWKEKYDPPGEGSSRK
ncbi:hypothetical protein BGZ61DRAFT_11784 [Ilyonectria robusta]|uniref:uncharacterized protein n=1 Tax=Ilyonectria robusta TaxID=1079257 RepID=UPI001E8EB2DB|nr:uncharacterized protein BGZ61DRAFT_11784 [Ilyonectria robusta]KAH8737247.1 hypothetical protein BGZ61DRAFT_11784 [Ilyonectria robusta]